MQCPICSAGRAREQLPLENYRVFRCITCNVEFLHPQPSSEVLTRIYSDNYLFGSRDGISQTEVVRQKRETAEIYVGQLLDARAGRKGVLLEIGSGSGDFLLAAQTRGFEVRGVEIAQEAVDRANQRLGAGVVKQNDIEALELPEGAFDAVVLSDVLEHVRDPASLLQKIHGSLRAQGTLFLVLPSTDSWSRRLMGKRWMEYKIEHLFYFNRKSLNYLLSHCGFDGVELSTNRKSLTFNYIRAHFRRYHIPFWSSAVEWTGKAIPDWLSAKTIRVVASGVAVMAHRSNAARIRNAEQA